MRTLIAKRFSEMAQKIDLPSIFVETSMQLHWEDAGGGAVRTKGPHEKDIIVSLTHFRPFYMKSSDFNFGKICSHILSDPKLEKYHVLTTKFLDAWVSILNGGSSPIGIQIDGNIWPAKKIFDIYFNQEYFHKEQYNARGLGRLEKNVFMKAVTNTIFIDIAQRLMQIVKAFDVQVMQKVYQEYEK